MKIGWKVSVVSTNIASLRYRAMLPLLALQALQVEGRIFDNGDELNLEGLDALVIVKSFKLDDLLLAKMASSMGVKVVFDLCDNIFISEYGQNPETRSPSEMFDEIAIYLDKIVVPTEALAAIVSQRLPFASVVVIPDGIETPLLVKSYGSLVRDAKAFQRRLLRKTLYHKIGNTFNYLRENGSGLLLHLARRVVNRDYRDLRRWVAQSSAKLANLALRKSKSIFTHSTSEPPRLQHAKTIVWFGNHGAPHARFGMLDLLEIRQELEAIAKVFDVELVVISNHRQKYEQHIKPLPIPSRYFEWSQSIVDQWLALADVVVIPNSLDLFSICKSANRTLLAISRGVPVVATETSAIVQLKPYIYTDNFLDGLIRYLNSRETGRDDAQSAYALAQRFFGQESIAKAWHAVLSNPTNVGHVKTLPKCVVALNLIQDLDLALPILNVWLQLGYPFEVWCSASLIKKSPRVLMSLEENKKPYRVIADSPFPEKITFPPEVKALLTVSESNLGPHRFTRNLSEIALTQGVMVATMQHGFENIGLTYDDSVHQIERINFKAQRIYLWGGLETLHPRVAPGVRSRCVPTGCPKLISAPPADLSHLLPQGCPVIGVFENLHWHRYNDTYRQDFLDAVGYLAESYPGVTFLVKPHHAGVWLSKRHEGKKPTAANLIIADPQSHAWEPYTATALLGHMTCVITTPSTVALDAARLCLPVAVVAGNMDLNNYHPLPLLRKMDDWSSFVNSALDIKRRQLLKIASADFVANVLIEADAAQRIAADITSIT